MNTKYTLAPCAALCLAVLPASADTFDSFTYKDNGTSITITSFPNVYTSVSIPDTIAGKPVTAIGDNAFASCQHVNGIYIPNSVKTIGSRAFQDCIALEGISIPDSVTKIGDYAFMGCGNIGGINVDPKNHSYASDEHGALFDHSKSRLIFYPPGRVGSYTIPSSVTSIDATAFEGSSGLTGGLTIPNGVTSIGHDTFSGCHQLKRVTIPNSVTYIGNSAFYFCGGLTEMKIPNSVTYIGDHAFYYCEQLKSMAIPNSVTHIGNSAFEYCTGLATIAISNSITSIETYTFAECYSLISVTIPNSVTSIGSYAFFFCNNLPSVTIPKNVTYIGSRAFWYCYDLTAARFLGDAPSTGKEAFSVPNLYFQIYCIKGKKGFSEPIWRGYPCVSLPGTPDIDVQQPIGSSLVSGSSKKSFGTLAVGQLGAARNFTIKNTGMSTLTGLTVGADGANAGDFQIMPPLSSSLKPGASTLFKVSFQPAANGTRTAEIHISSNDVDENPFDIKLAGEGATP